VFRYPKEKSGRRTANFERTPQAMMDEVEVKNMLKLFKEKLDNAPDSQAAIVWAGGVSAIQLILEETE
jgi:hypothetical protein